MKLLFKVFWCSLLVLLFSASPSYALILGSVTGDWVNPAGGDLAAVNYADVSVAYGSGVESRILYGIPAGGDQSGLGFTGVGAPYTFDPGDAFELGRLRHFNTPTVQGSSITGVDLLLGMTFIDPVAAGQVGFTLSLNNTINTGSGDDDYLLFPSTFEPLVFVVDDTQYTFELLGLGSDPNSLISLLQTPENGLSSTSLWGRITTAPLEPVPEPVTLILFGTGFLALAGARIRSRG